MNKFFRFFLYINVFVVSAFFLWVMALYFMQKANIQMPELGETTMEKLYTLSEINPIETGQKLTDVTIYTLAAPTIDKWVFFDFSKGSIIPSISDFKDPNWDIAFRRAKIASNGGGTNKQGQVEIAKLNTTDFDSVSEVPENALFTKDVKLSPGADPKNISIDKWYSYNFMDHNLKSYKNVFIVKTAEGNYAKMQILNYYCKKGKERVSSCYSIKYVYQGDGSKKFGNVTDEPAQQMKKTG